MKILVMGTGGIGGYYGGRLAEAGADVFFVARGRHLEALQAEGLRITSPAGDFHLTQARASANPLDAGEVEVVILATKAWDVEKAAQLVKPALKKDGFLVHFQNGVNITEIVSSVFERSQIIAGLSYGVVQLAEPGHIHHATKVHQLTYGPLQHPPSPYLSEFHERCKKANFDANLVDNIETQLWTKFLIICAYSGITGLMRLPIGPIMADADTRALYQGCMQEIDNVARAKKIPLPEGIVQERLIFSRRDLEPTATSSMQRDFAAGHRTELAYLNGAVSRMGKEMGVPTPINDFVFTSLKLHDGLKPIGRLEKGAAVGRDLPTHPA